VFVKDVVSRADAAEAIKSALEQSNYVEYYDKEDIAESFADALTLAARREVGDAVERRLNDFNVRH
jgi:hypothetical protein